MDPAVKRLGGFLWSMLYRGCSDPVLRGGGHGDLLTPSSKELLHRKGLIVARVLSFCSGDDEGGGLLVVAARTEGGTSVRVVCSCIAIRIPLVVYCLYVYLYCIRSFLNTSDVYLRA